MRHLDGAKVVVVVTMAAIILMALMVWRVYMGVRNDMNLCEKIDRLVVNLERGAKVNPDLSPAEQQERIAFWESFRNDPPVCRTH